MSQNAALPLQVYLALKKRNTTGAYITEKLTKREPSKHLPRAAKLSNNLSMCFLIMINEVMMNELVNWRFSPSDDKSVNPSV